MSHSLGSWGPIGLGLYSPVRPEGLQTDVHPWAGRGFCEAGQWGGRCLASWQQRLDQARAPGADAGPLRLPWLTGVGAGPVAWALPCLLAAGCGGLQHRRDFRTVLGLTLIVKLPFSPVG